MIRWLLEGFEDFQVSHIGWEGNVVGDKMANVGVDLQENIETAEGNRSINFSSS